VTAEMTELPTRERLLVTPEEAGEMLGLGRTTVYGLLASRQLASVRIGRARRIPVAALNSFIATLQKIDPT
jgi:excisionase family DNA binding protein